MAEDSGNEVLAPLVLTRSPQGPHIWFPFPSAAGPAEQSLSLWISWKISSKGQVQATLYPQSPGNPSSERDPLLSLPHDLLETRRPMLEGRAKQWIWHVFCFLGELGK